MGDRQPFPQQQLSQISSAIQAEYSENRRVLSFSEYLDIVASKPRQQLRSAPQYVKDAFDHFGTREINYPGGKMRRFRLFDCEWAEGRDKLVGHELVQNRVYRALEKFVHGGTSNKLVLLHGPNGSAKSTFIRAIGRALQHYSTLDSGALYRINWVFPMQRTTQGGIGFSGKSKDALSMETFAHLPDELVDAKLTDELNEHPLLLVPPKERATLMDSLLSMHVDKQEFVLSDYMRFGRLSHRNKTIYESLLASYHGDYKKVLRHVQVERFYVQHRYRTGYVTVEPQMSVDARERQVTADRSVSALPAALQSVALFEYGGELVGANRGLIEYSDFLKRPLEAYKYLIATVERASVSLPNATLFLDMVFMGTTNEVHLEAFKEIPEYQSFKGRLELVRVPYLRDFVQEQEIYGAPIREAAGAKHVAPHCAYVAALWAVLTRMKKPQKEHYGEELAALLEQMTPLEKAELYALGKIPESLPATQGNLIFASLDAIRTEWENYPNYEGRTGASPRDVLAVLFNAANASPSRYVSPLDVLQEIEQLIKQGSVFEFLKQEAQPGGYHDYLKLVAQVKERLLDRLDTELRSSLGLVTEQEYERVFYRYVTHVMHWTKKEKVLNPTTGHREDPDETLMGEVERILEIGTDSKNFRHDLIAKIGAWSLDHPDKKPTYASIFADHFRRLKAAYFAERRKQVRKELEELLVLLAEDGAGLDAEATSRTTATRNRLIENLGYQDESIRDTVSLLLRHRYT